MAPEDYADMKTFFADGAAGQWRWGTACSGSESPHWAYNALESVLSEAGVSGAFKHMFSAELEPEKRRWICFSHEPMFDIQ